MQNYFSKWVKLSGCSESYEGLRDLILREQFMDMVPMELAVFLSEREPKNSEELVKLADRYLHAHSSHSKVKNPFGKQKSDQGSSGLGGPHIAPSQVGSGDHRAVNLNRDSKESGKREIHGFNKPSPGGFGRNGPRETRKCNICFKEGHLANSCYRRERGYCALVPKETGKSLHGQENNPDAEYGKQEISDDIPIMTALNQSNDCGCGMPVGDGWLNGKPVQVMRDTGCSGLVVNKSMVTGDRYTGNHKTCIFLDSSKRTFPTEMVNLNCPWFKGTGEAMVVDGCPYDVILGNLEKASFPHKEETRKEKQVSEATLKGGDGEETKCDMETGLVSKIETRPIVSSEEFGELPVGREALINLQKKDESIKFIF